MAGRLYDLRRWRRASRQFLMANPYCAMCQAAGRVTLATLTDHVQPHRGDLELFWDAENLQSLCAPCHSGAKQEIEKSGTIRGCDADGRPLDPGHHWNAGR